MNDVDVKYQREFSEHEQEVIDMEFQRLADTVYLDHAGTTLYAESQINNCAKQLNSDVICNPHTCRSTGDFVDQVRYKILKFFNTSKEHYDVVFTANATAALRMVAEHFQFSQDGNDDRAGSFYYCQENHHSVLGMRELVTASSIHMLTQAQLVANDKAHNGQAQTLKVVQPHIANSLVAFSAQCNFSGFKMPLNIIETIRNYGLTEQGKCIKGNETAGTAANYYVCLDAASFVASNFMDLQRYQPDFMCVSFYKIFGYPTGVGALLVSRRGAEALRKRFYGGGTVNYAYPHTMEHRLRETFHERFEDGTLPFLSIVELLHGFNTLERLVPPLDDTPTMERISKHVFGLARYCEQRLKQLRYKCGSPLIKFYSHCGYEHRSRQGGLVAFNVLTDDGGFVGFGEIACLAAMHGILLRTGCFCNMGACQHHLVLDDATMDSIYRSGNRVCGDYNDLFNGQPTGAVRVSFGYMTRVEHLERFFSMLLKCYLMDLPQSRAFIIGSNAKKLPQALQNRAHIGSPRILELAIYPIKSCAALKISQAWPLTPQGLQYDRQWMIVDMNGMALTQKKCPKLCLLRPRIVGQYLELVYANSVDTVKVPLTVPAQNSIDVHCQSKVCRDPIEGLDCGDKVASWLSTQLLIDGLRLLRQSNQRINQRASLSLVNQAQFLLVNRSSVLSLEFEEPVQQTIDRFRANIIIDTQQPFEELGFKKLVIGGVHFRIDGPCQRCEMICINQSTGERSPETLTTIARMQEGKIKFGLYISMEPDSISDSSFTLKVGEAVTVSTKD